MGRIQGSEGVCLLFPGPAPPSTPPAIVQRRLNAEGPGPKRAGGNLKLCVRGWESEVDKAGHGPCPKVRGIGRPHDLRRAYKTARQYLEICEAALLRLKGEPFEKDLDLLTGTPANRKALELDIVFEGQARDLSQGVLFCPGRPGDFFIREGKLVRLMGPGGRADHDRLDHIRDRGIRRQTGAEEQCF